jgi:alpha-mannosidase
MMILKPQQQLERCRRVMRQRVQPHIHPLLDHCAVRAVDNPGEPIPSGEFLAQMRNGSIAFHDFAIGSPWGTTWGTTWFEIRGRIKQQPPKGGCPLELMLDLGWYDHSVGGHIEGLAYRADGTTIKAVHPRNYWVPIISAGGKANVPINGDGDFTLYLEAASNPLLLGVPPFIETELGDHATGKPDEPYIFRGADLCAFDATMQDLYLDLDVVSSLMEQLHDDTPRYWQLAKALQRALNAYDEQNPVSALAARGELAEVLSRHADASAMHVSAVGHAHIDSAWLWPVRETRRKVARTVSNVLALMDEDEDFKYAMSSAQQYAWLEEDHPDLFARMKERIAEGRFIPVGGMWVESDGMIPTGESLIRQISFGKRYFRERLGVDPKGIWLPDSFGYTGAWPQIARRAGFEWFLTQKISWNDTTKFPHHSFLWEGIDGSRIFTHFPPSDTYAASVTAQELTYAERNFRDKDLADHSLMLYGYGDGGGGPTREMMGRVRRFHDLEGVSKVVIESPDEFFDAALRQLEEQAGSEIPVWHGELYLELHRATLTSQQEMKRGCRAEESMLRTVEYLCAAAALLDRDYTYPSEELNRIWKTLLLNQFHDILPGSGIAWVHREAREAYRRDLAQLRQIAARACTVLRDASPDARVLPQGRIAQYRLDGGSWQSEPLHPHDATAAAATIRKNETGGVTLSNGILDAVIEPDGTVSSVYDTAHDRDLLPAGTCIGRYELLKDEPSVWDAWDIERDALLCATPLANAEIADIQVVDGTAMVHVCQRHADVGIETVISLSPGSWRLDFSAHIDWHAKERFLKVDMPMAVVADRAQYECQYGLVERPIGKNTASDEAKYESCSNRFVRIADHEYAIAVVNSSVYGCDASPIHGERAAGAQPGTMLRLSLLESPVFPDPHTDQGEHDFAWSLLADATIERTLDAASVLNAPELGNLPMLEPLIRLDGVSGVPVIDWMKRADDGSEDLIVRIYEAAGGHAQARLRVSPALDGMLVSETNELEEPELPDDLPIALPDAASLADAASSDSVTSANGWVPAQGARIRLEPFQLTTLRFRLGGGRADRASL